MGIRDRRYRALAENRKNNKVFAREEQQGWQCRNCGYTYIGKSAPLKCPVCAHPQSYDLREALFFGFLGQDVYKRQILYAASVLNESHGTLKGLFRQIVEERTDILFPVKDRCV